LAKEHW
jgi:hypothetical protein